MDVGWYVIVECPGATAAFRGPHVPRILTVDYTFKRKMRMRFYNFRHRCPNDELAIYIKCSVIVCLRRVWQHNIFFIVSFLLLFALYLAHPIHITLPLVHFVTQICRITQNNFCTCPYVADILNKDCCTFPYLGFYLSNITDVRVDFRICKIM